ncbi:uncharacterized protein LOC144179898 [Haemaphysalis longicornis]
MAKKFEFFEAQVAEGVRHTLRLSAAALPALQLCGAIPEKAGGPPVHTHQGQSPCQCNRCTTAFAHKGSRVAQLCIRMGDRPCHCSEAFVYKGSALKLSSEAAAVVISLMSDMLSYCSVDVLNDVPDLSNKPRCWFILTVFVGGSALSFFPVLPVAGPSNGHQRQHDPPPGRRLFHCQQCSYVTPSSSNLKKHIRTHTGERPHQCSHCDKAFVDKSTLVSHVRIHTGERPHQCSQCGKAFVQKAHLVRHLRIHTGERPYECHLCPMTFAFRNSLVSHVHSHRARCCLR